MSTNLLQDITSVATLLTAVAALLTILELRRQRTASYRPALAIEDQPVAIYRPVEAEPDQTIVFHPGGKPPVGEVLPGSNVRFRIRNVGAGPALEVEARWEFDPVEFAALVAQADPEVGSTILVGKDFIRCGTWGLARQNAHYLGTLFSSPDVLSVEVPMPSAYAALASFLFRAVLDKELDTAMQAQLPTLTLCIAYRDRGGSNFESRYRISFELYFLAPRGLSIRESAEWLEVGAGNFAVRACT